VSSHVGWDTSHKEFNTPDVEATFCMFVDQVQLRQDTGEIAARQQVAARFKETFRRYDGTMKWTQGQKIDSGGDLASDCAGQRPS
jgi:hypothetical protein